MQKNETGEIFLRVYPSPIEEGVRAMVTVYDTNVLTRIDVATKQNFNEKVVSEEKVILLIASINLINYERGRPGPVSL